VTRSPHCSMNTQDTLQNAGR